MTMIWPAYLINLAENTGRYARSKTQFDAQGISFRRINAVNGWNLSVSEIAHVYDAEANARRGKLPLVPPEIGCYLSHVEAWRIIAEDDAPGGFIFEDDFEANEMLAPCLRKLSVDYGWDSVKLYSLDPNPPMHDRRDLQDGITVGIPWRIPSSTIGYGLTRNAARRLARQAIPFFRPVDKDQKFYWETGLRVALVSPQPIRVGDQRTTTGTVGQARRAAVPNRRSIERAVHNLKYRLGYVLRLHYHRWKGTFQ